MALKSTKTTELTLRMLRLIARVRGEPQSQVLEKLVASEFSKPIYDKAFRAVVKGDLEEDFEPEVENDKG